MSPPTRELSCQRLPDCAAHVLGAFDEQEAQAHRAHLAECRICRAEVDQLQLVADVLALGVPRVRVPLSLRGRIVGAAHAEAEAQQGAPRHETGGAASARVGGGSVPTDPGRGSVPTDPGRGSVSREIGTHPPGRAIRLRPALAGMLAVGVGIAIGALVFSSSSPEKTEAIRAVVIAPGHHATAELRKAGSHLELVVVGMPAPPPGRIYEVWIEHGAEAPLPTDALFSVTRTGAGSVGVPGDLRGVSRVLVTDEPLGGSPKPTRTPVIVGSV